MRHQLLYPLLVTVSMASAAPAQQIVVGPNIPISAARPRDPHSEPVIATDPNHPERLIAASHIAYHDTSGVKSIAYVSFDTGRTWSVSLDRRDSTITADAAVAYGVDGSALFATLARWGWKVTSGSRPASAQPPGRPTSGRRFTCLGMPRARRRSDERWARVAAIPRRARGAPARSRPPATGRARSSRR